MLTKEASASKEVGQILRKLRMTKLDIRNQEREDIDSIHREHEDSFSFSDFIPGPNEREDEYGNRSKECHEKVDK